MLAWLVFFRSEEDDILGPRPSTLSWRDHLFWDLPSHLLLLGRIPISKWGLKPNIRVQVFALTYIYIYIYYFLEKSSVGHWINWLCKIMPLIRSISVNYILNFFYFLCARKFSQMQLLTFNNFLCVYILYKQ